MHVIVSIWILSIGGCSRSRNLSFLQWNWTVYFENVKLCNSFKLPDFSRNCWKFGVTLNEWINPPRCPFNWISKTQNFAPNQLHQTHKRQPVVLVNVGDLRGSPETFPNCFMGHSLSAHRWRTHFCWNYLGRRKEKQLKEICEKKRNLNDDAKLDWPFRSQFQLAPWRQSSPDHGSCLLNVVKI